MTFADRYGPWALVAGASEGIGAAFAHALARRGLSVVLVARRLQPLEATARALSVPVRTVVADLADPHGPAAVASAVADLDVGLVVANAALSLTSPFLELELAELHRTVQLNVMAPVELARRLGPRLVARGRGGLVLMSSLAAITGAPRVAAYAGSRAFVLAWGESLGVELAEHGVDVVTVAAGPTRTPTYTAVAPPRFPPMLSADDVVTSALHALGRRPRAVPGWFNRATASLMAVLPRGAALALVNSQTSKFKSRTH